jgi:aminoglycoside 3-N-acetyltransferase
VTITKRHIETALEELALHDSCVMVHASLRSFGDGIESGADTILDALLARGCTVLVPSFTEPQFGVAPPSDMRPPQNAVDYHDLADWPDHDRIYTADCGVINLGMGALPARLIARDGARRGTHPLNSFAALGPLAAHLVAGQSPADVYAPIRVLDRRQGTVLLVGVGLNRMTALHLAEQRVGRRLLIRWARRPDGRICMVETGSCSAGFPRLAPYLDHCSRTTTVGASRWSAYPLAETLRAAVEQLHVDPSITRCTNEGCRRCRDSIAGGPRGPVLLG